MAKLIPMRLGFFILNLGLLFLVTANFYDSAGHWYGVPENFFTPAHLAVYVGVAIILLGSFCILMQSGSYINQIIKLEKAEHSIKSNFSAKFGLFKRPLSSAQMLQLSIKLIFYGIIILLLAGPFDYAWHTAFGLDGLLSPPHAVFRAGQAVCGVGSLLGIVSIYGGVNSRSKNNAYRWIYPISIIITMGALWAGFIRILNMVTLPFSNTGYFDWNPNPLAAAAIATVAFPLLNSLILYCSFRLGSLNQNYVNTKGKLIGQTYNSPKFGILTLVGFSYLAMIAFTILISNKYLMPTVPFYLLNIIPILIVDLLLTKIYFKNLRFTSKKVGQIIIGGILGLLFFTIQFPYLTFTYSEILENHESITPKNLTAKYLDITQILPVVSLPAIVSGIVGIFIGVKLFPPYRSKQISKPE